MNDIDMNIEENVESGSIKAPLIDGWVEVYVKGHSWNERIRNVFRKDSALFDCVEVIIADGSLAASTCTVLHWWIALNLGGTYNGVPIRQANIPSHHMRKKIENAKKITDKMMNGLWYVLPSVDELLSLIVTDQDCTLVTEDGVALFMDESDLPMWACESVGLEGEWLISKDTREMSGMFLIENGCLVLEMVEYRELEYKDAFCADMLVQVPKGATSVDIRLCGIEPEEPILPPLQLSTLPLHDMAMEELESIKIDLSGPVGHRAVQAGLYWKLKREIATRRIQEQGVFHREWYHDWLKFGASSLQSVNVYLKKDKAVATTRFLFFLRQLIPYFYRRGLPDELVAKILENDKMQQERFVFLNRSHELNTMMLLTLDRHVDESPLYFKIEGSNIRVSPNPLREPGSFVMVNPDVQMDSQYNDQLIIFCGQNSCVLSCDYLKPGTELFGNLYQYAHTQRDEEQVLSLLQHTAHMMGRDEVGRSIWPDFKFPRHRLNVCGDDYVIGTVIGGYDWEDL